MFAEIDVGCHRCSVSLRLDGVSHASGACFVVHFVAFTWCFTCLQCMLRGVDVGCYPCSGVYMVFHMFSVHIDVCKTHAKPWVRLAFKGE